MCAGAITEGIVAVVAVYPEHLATQLVPPLTPQLTYKHCLLEPPHLHCIIQFIGAAGVWQEHAEQQGTLKASCLAMGVKHRYRSSRLCRVRVSGATRACCCLVLQVLQLATECQLACTDAV